MGSAAAQLAVSSITKVYDEGVQKLFSGLLVFRYLHLNIDAACGRVDCRDNKVDVWSPFRPLLLAHHNNGYCAARKVLLIAHFLVGRYKHIKPSGFGGVE